MCRVSKDIRKIGSQKADTLSFSQLLYFRTSNEYSFIYLSVTFLESEMYIGGYVHAYVHDLKSARLEKSDTASDENVISACLPELPDGIFSNRKSQFG
jgi:hypothetical protein